MTPSSPSLFCASRCNMLLFGSHFYLALLVVCELFNSDIALADEAKKGSLYCQRVRFFSMLLPFAHLNPLRFIVAFVLLCF